MTFEPETFSSAPSLYFFEQNDNENKLPRTCGLGLLLSVRKITDFQSDKYDGMKLFISDISHKQTNMRWVILVSHKDKNRRKKNC
jgi:hypothetical protein